MLIAAESLLGKALARDQSRPAQIVTIAKLHHVLWLLPRVSRGVNASLCVFGPDTGRAECNEVKGGLAQIDAY
jgi:hypothetical protein